MKAAFYTLGCKVNQYESQAMLEQLERAGYTIVSCDDEADVYIVNSCTVTASGDQKTRQAIRRFKREHPGCTVVLTGCMPQAYPEKSSAIPEADIILGNKNNAALVKALSEYWMTGNRRVEISLHEIKRGEEFSNSKISAFNERTRAFVKIEDGCDRFCSYCVIPYARGRVRSRSLDSLMPELKSLAENGYREIVLVGINLSAYGKDTGVSFCDAVSAACEPDGIARVRLGSLEPDHLTPEVVGRLARLPKLCPQFHISLQSGCDETLKRMNRHYTAAEYMDICRNLRESFPNAALTTDVMVGFPGETQAEFEASMAFVRSVGFSKIHVFPYSPREGTKAAEMKDQIPQHIKKERCRAMIDAGQELREKFLSGQVGGIYPALFETPCADNIYEGYTPNYTPVRVSSAQSLCGKILNVKITAACEDWCEGILA